MVHLGTVTTLQASRYILVEWLRYRLSGTSWYSDYPTGLPVHLGTVTTLQAFRYILVQWLRYRLAGTSWYSDYTTGLPVHLGTVTTLQASKYSLVQWLRYWFSGTSLCLCPSPWKWRQYNSAKRLFSSDYTASYGRTQQHIYTDSSDSNNSFLAGLLVYTERCHMSLLRWNDVTAPPRHHRFTTHWDTKRLQSVLQTSSTTAVPEKLPRITGLQTPAVKLRHYALIHIDRNECYLNTSSSHHSQVTY
jgi:hypothetical protein